MKLTDGVDVVDRLDCKDVDGHPRENHGCADLANVSFIQIEAHQEGTI